MGAVACGHACGHGACLWRVGFSARNILRLSVPGPDRGRDNDPGRRGRATGRDRRTSNIQHVKQPIHRNHSGKATCASPSRLTAALPPSLYVLNVHRCDRCTRKTLRTRNTSSPLALVSAFFHSEPAGTCSSQGVTCPCPEVSLCLTHDSGFFACLSAVARRAADMSASFSPPQRALPPRDCPFLRPRAGLPLSMACDSPFAMSFGTTLRTRFPSSSRHAVGCCMLTSRSFKRPSACSIVWSHISMLPTTHAA